MKKGPKFEADVVAWLQSHGFPYAERRVMGGNRDRGDVAGIPGVCLELKNCREWKLAGWIEEARAEAANAGCAVWAVVVKRPKMSDPGEAYVVTNLATFAHLIGDDPLEVVA
jgi:hypothetical protein